MASSSVEITAMASSSIEITFLERLNAHVLAECEKRERLRQFYLAHPQTPLHVAAAHGHYDVVKFVLKSADAQSIYRQNVEGNTPLHLAAQSGSTQILQVFLALTKSNLDCVNGKHQTPLHLAALNGRLDAVKLLLENGADTNACDKEGAMPLHFAALNGRLDAVKLLLENGADRNACDKEGAMPFHCAARSGHTSTMVELFPDESLTILINKRITDGRTALHLAAQNGHRDTVEWLLLYGADVNATDSVDGDTALHWAVKGHSADVVETLMKWGANAHQPNRDGKLPLNLKDLLTLDDVGKAIPWAVKNISAYLYAHDSFRSSIRIYFGGFYHDVDRFNRDIGKVVKSMLQQENPAHRGVDVLDNIKWDDRNGYPLRNVCTENDIFATCTEFAKQVLSILGPELCIDRERLDTLLPLFVALEAGKESNARLMQELDKMAVNRTDRFNQRTTLHWAVIRGQTGIVRTLCRTKEFEEDMLPHLPDKHGKTALTYAIEMDDPEIIKELLELKSLQSSNERLYKDRQLYIDSANAILVGAALIASVTFASWLQPPLNNTIEPYKNHLEVRLFWAFNSLSFLFAIATVLTGAGTVLPMPNIDIAVAVRIIRERMFYTALLLAFSIVFVIGAFAAAGFAALLKHRANMIATLAVGGFLCTFILVWYILQLGALVPQYITRPIIIVTDDLEFRWDILKYCCCKVCHGIMLVIGATGCALKGKTVAATT